MKEKKLIGQSSLFQTLAKSLEEAYKKKYAEEKQKQISFFHQVTPGFSMDQFLVSFGIHLLYFWVLGPLMAVFAPCFKATGLFKNMAFIPSRIHSFVFTF